LLNQHTQLQKRHAAITNDRDRRAVIPSGNWELGTGNWELGTGNWELGTGDVLAPWLNGNPYLGSRRAPTALHDDVIHKQQINPSEIS
jgi:hypothetical protein